jgi:hypothetical protein
MGSWPVLDDPETDHYHRLLLYETLSFRIVVRKLLMMLEPSDGYSTFLTMLPKKSKRLGLYRPAF